MNKKLSEEDVKYRYITVALEKAGWRKENISMEYFTDGQILVEGNVVRRGNKKEWTIFYAKPEDFR